MKKKYPILLSLLYVIIMSIFVSIATAISMALELSQSKTMLLQGFSFLMSTTIALVIMVKSKYTLCEYGLRLKFQTNTVGYLIIVPVILAEAITLFAGINKDLTYIDFAAIAAFMIVAVIHEEIYFRGLILKTLSVKGSKFAITVSALLFGLVHLGSMTVGKGMGHTILLVVVSGLFAFVSAEIVVLTGSLLIPVMWHFTRNIISSVTLEAPSEITLIIVAVQCMILLIQAVFLWIRISKRKSAEAMTLSA